MTTDCDCIAEAVVRALSKDREKQARRRRRRASMAEDRSSVTSSFSRNIRNQSFFEQVAILRKRQEVERFAALEETTGGTIRSSQPAVSVMDAPIVEANGSRTVLVFSNLSGVGLTIEPVTDAGGPQGGLVMGVGSNGIREFRLTDHGKLCTCAWINKVAIPGSFVSVYEVLS